MSYTDAASGGYSSAVQDLVGNDARSFDVEVANQSQASGPPDAAEPPENLEAWENCDFNNSFAPVRLTRDAPVPLPAGDGRMLFDYRLRKLESDPRGEWTQIWSVNAGQMEKYQENGRLWYDVFYFGGEGGFDDNGIPSPPDPKGPADGRYFQIRVSSIRANGAAGPWSGPSNTAPVRSCEQE